MPENLQKQHLTNPNRNLKVKMFYIDRKLFVTFFFHLLLENSAKICLYQSLRARENFLPHFITCAQTDTSICRIGLIFRHDQLDFLETELLEHHGKNVTQT